MLALPSPFLFPTPLRLSLVHTGKYYMADTLTLTVVTHTKMKSYTFAIKYIPGLERTRRQKTKGGKDTHTQSKGVSPSSLKCLMSQ